MNKSLQFKNALISLLILTLFLQVNAVNAQAFVISNNLATVQNKFNVAVLNSISQKEVYVRIALDDTSNFNVIQSLFTSYYFTPVYQLSTLFFTKNTFTKYLNNNYIHLRFSPKIISCFLV